MKSMGAKRVGIALTYGTQDFSDKLSSTDGETVAVIASITDIEAFRATKTTEDKFASQCDVYLHSGANWRKIELKLQ